MVDSLRDQLLKAGFKPSPRPDPVKGGARAAASRPDKDRPRQDKRQESRKGAKPDARKAVKPAAARDGEIDLARAYALRHAQEQREKAAAERAAAERARLRKEQREKTRALVHDKTLNLAEAELLRHFEYGGKIRRVHVDEAQLHALNMGALGVVQLDGRYLLVERALAEAVREAAPQHVALLVDPDAVDGDEFGETASPG